MKWKPDLVCYHASCADGFGSAWSAHKRWGDAVQYLACSYGEPLPIEAMASKNVLVADFSWKRDDMRKLGAVAETMVVLDHHKSAQAELKEWVVPHDPGRYFQSLHQEDFGRRDEKIDLFPIIACFDMEKSGARMAWEFCHGAGVPRLIEHIEDRDLWRFRLAYTREIHAAICSFDFSFDRFDDFSADLKPVIFQGGAILRAHNRRVEELCEFSYEAEIAGITGVRILNAPYFFASDCGHRLLNMFPDAPFAAVWSRRNDGKDQYSLRSEDARMDVSKVAARMGGGGHRNASGFAVEVGVPE